VRANHAEAKQPSAGQARTHESQKRLVVAWLLVSFLCLGSGACGRASRSAAAAPSSASPSQQAAAAELYRAGLSYLRRADLTRAEQYFASALAGGHDAELCLKALMLTTVRASRLRSALTYAWPALQEHPGDVPLRLLVATLLLALEELVPAERELARALALDAESPEAHYLLALVRRRRGASPTEQRLPLARYLELAPRGSHAEEVRDLLREALDEEAVGAPPRPAVPRRPARPLLRPRARLGSLRSGA
jgi:predicted Zn-dependent protease